MSHHHHHHHDRNHRPHTPETWRVELTFDEHDDEAVTTADLFVGDATYEAHGSTNVTDLGRAVARQMATARALAGLSHQLVDDASLSVNRLARAVSVAAGEAAETYAELE
jgi:hypothetical protein